MADPTWIDRFVARPARIEHLPYGDERNPWFCKWRDAKRCPRDRWPWRIRLEIWWFHREYTIGLLYWRVHRFRDLREPGFGVHIYDTGKGWIEALAT